MQKNRSLLLNSVISYLTMHYRSVLAQLGIISLGVLTWFIILGLLYWSNDADLSWFQTPVGLLSIVFFFIYFVEMTFLIVNISALAFWICAKKFKGKGTFLQTTTDILWAVLPAFILFCLFFLLMELQTNVGMIICNLSGIGIIGCFIYGMVAISTKLSKVHGFSSDEGANTFVLGVLLQLPFLIPLIFFISTQMRSLYVVLVPLTMQMLTTFTIIFLGIKALEKLKTLRIR